MKKLLFILTTAFSLSGVVVTANAFDVNTGPIWNNDDAKQKCPSVCNARPGATWNGNWVTTVPGKMSVCGCERDRSFAAGLGGGGGTGSGQCEGGVCFHPGR